MFKQSYQLFRLAVKENPTEIKKNLALAVLLEVVSVILLYILNQVYGDLYGGIQAYDQHIIWTSIAKFTGIAMVLVGVNGYMSYFINRLAFDIRSGLTFHYFKIRDTLPLIANLNQRVQEDLKRFGEASCDLWFGVLKSLLHIPVFLGVIITLTQWYTGLAIFAAVAIGTVVTRLVARRLVLEQSVQESNEARFRETLLILNYAYINKQFQVINKLFKRLAFTQAGLGQIFVLLPFMVLMPLYISKAVTMGAFFQAVNALGKIIDSLSILIDSRQIIVNVETCLVRLSFLTDDRKDK